MKSALALLFKALAFAAPFVNGQRPLLRIGTKAEDEAEDEARTEKALKIWSQSRPLRGSLAEHYLRSRGIEVPAEAREVLRFHAECPFDGRLVPALVALVVCPTLPAQPAPPRFC